MTDAHILEKARWTEAEFDLMGWHDATIHAMEFRPDAWEFALDIDYVLRWVEPEPGEQCFRFWVSPATLVFENVSELRIDLEPVDNVEMQGLERGASEPTREGFAGPRTQWRWTIDCLQGEITFAATGFHQVFRRPPVLQSSQCLSRDQRGATSFDESPFEG